MDAVVMTHAPAPVDGALVLRVCPKSECAGDAGHLNYFTPPLPGLSVCSLVALSATLTVLAFPLVVLLYLGLASHIFSTVAVYDIGTIRLVSELVRDSVVLFFALPAVGVAISLVEIARRKGMDALSTATLTFNVAMLLLDVMHRAVR
jgi:hypothetical protein